MSKSDRNVGESAITPEQMDTISKVTGLLADKDRVGYSTYRAAHGYKFPVVTLILSSPDFDSTTGNGSRVSYVGVIDRASRDAMSEDPYVAVRSRGEQVYVPVVQRKPMIVDGNRLASMAPEIQEATARLASSALADLGMTV